VVQVRLRQIVVRQILYSLGSLLTSCKKSYCYCYLHIREIAELHRSVSSMYLAKDRILKTDHKYTLTPEQDSVFLALFVPPFHIDRHYCSF